MLKTQIVDYLRNQTAFFEPSLVSEIFTESNIATTFTFFIKKRFNNKTIF